MDLTIKKFREKKVEEITMLKEQLRNDPNNTGILKRLRDIEDEFYGVIAALEEDTRGNIARHLKPYTLKALARLYNISTTTMKSWLEPFRDQIGKKIGIYYNLAQVRMIFNKLDLPSELSHPLIQDKKEVGFRYHKIKENLLFGRC